MTVRQSEHPLTRAALTRGPPSTLSRDARGARGEGGRAYALPLHVPGGRAVFVVFERDAHGGELVADAIGFLRHCERSEAIHAKARMIAALALDCFVAALLAMTRRVSASLPRSSCRPCCP